MEYFLQHTELDIKYCITWANENWTALWDGKNKDLIFEQNWENSDLEKFIDDLVPYFADDRYIRINNKLLLVVYRLNIWKKDFVRKMFQGFRDEMKKRNMDELYILGCNSHGVDENAEEWGADALVEFPPHGIDQRTSVIRIDGYLNPNFVGCVRNVDEFIKEKNICMNIKVESIFGELCHLGIIRQGKQIMGRQYIPGLRQKHSNSG